MKSLTVFLSILLLGSVSAQGLGSVRVDLDEDGKLDKVVEKRHNDLNNKLEITLSSLNKKFTYLNILPASSNAKYCSEGIISTTIHKDVMKTELRRIDNKIVEAQNIVTINIKSGGMSDCSYERNTTLKIGFENGKLMVAEKTTKFESYSSGDPSPMEMTRLNFGLNSSYRSFFEYEYIEDIRSDFGLRVKKSMDSECKLSLNDYAYLNGDDPACVKKLQDKVNL